MLLLLAIILSIPLAIHGGIAHDFSPERQDKQPDNDKTIWINEDLSSVYLSPTDRREQWGMSLPPWDMVELIDSHCAYRACDTNITIPTAVLIHRNQPPAMANVTLRVLGYFETTSFKGTKRDFIQVLKLFLNIMHNALDTDFIKNTEQDPPTGNISEPGYQPVYTGPKEIKLRIKNDRDNSPVRPFLTMRVDSGARDGLLSAFGFCKDMEDKRTELVDTMARKFGTELVIYRMGCIVPHRDNSTFVPHKNNSTFLPHKDNSTFLPHKNNSTFVPHKNNSTFLPHKNNSTFLPHKDNSTFVPHKNNSTFLPHKG